MSDLPCPDCGVMPNGWLCQGRYAFYECGNAVDYWEMDWINGCCA